MFHAKWLDSWRRIHTPYTNVNGTWRRIKASWTKVDGVWKYFYIEAPAKFSVPNSGTTEVGRLGAGGNRYYFQNRDLVIPPQYYGYSIVGVSGTWAASQAFNGGSGFDSRQVTLYMNIKDKASTVTRTAYQSWPGQGQQIGSSGGTPIYYDCGGQVSYFWGQTGDAETGYWRNYTSYDINFAFEPLVLTSNINIYWYISNLDDDCNAQGYWSNMKFTVQNPHTGDTVALSFA